MTLAPGSEFAGYRIEGLAGEGGMGAVYRAQQDRPRRTVALKVIAADLSADPQFRSRFDREAELAASIEHPNIVPVHEVGEHEGRLFIAMRFIDGHDVATVLRDGPLPPQRAVAIVERVAAALAAAHHAGLVHRDVKPANVLLRRSSDGDEHVYLTDFGLARRTVETVGLTGSGQFMGTPAFAAPEQIRGLALDARTDVYALGCLLFNALTAQTPFPRNDPTSVMWAHVNDTPPAPSRHAAGIPAGLDQVVAMAMAKDPGRRFESTTALARAARAAIDNARATCPKCMAPLGDTPFCAHCGSSTDTLPLLTSPTRPRVAAEPTARDPDPRRHGDAARDHHRDGRAPSSTRPLPWVRLGGVGVFAALIVLVALLLLDKQQDPSTAALTGTTAAATPSSEPTTAGPDGTPAATAEAAESTATPKPRKRKPKPVAEVPVERTVAFHTGYDAGKKLPAAYCRITSDQLYCWTPNDGYTIRVGSGRPARVRGDEPGNKGRLPDYRLLRLGSTSSAHGYRCTSRSTGLSCQNAAGHGWTLPRYVGLPAIY